MVLCLDVGSELEEEINGNLPIPNFQEYCKGGGEKIVEKIRQMINY